MLLLYIKKTHNSKQKQMFAPNHSLTCLNGYSVLCTGYIQFFALPLYVRYVYLKRCKIKSL